MPVRRHVPALSTTTAHLAAAALFMLGAIVQAIGASVVSFDVIPDFAGSRWLRIHLITLGIVTQITFAVVSARATRSDGEGPAWAIWASLNAGLLALIAGIPPVNATLIITGGALVLLAAILLIRQIARIPRTSGRPASVDAAFYLAGLGFLLVGVTLGTGLWLGWDTQWLHVANPREAHVHANGFGFTALVLAGILLRLAQQTTGEPVLGPTARRVVLYGMIVGAAGLVAGPWVGRHPLSVVGLLSHTLATGVFLRHLWAAHREARGDVGILHLLGAYVWFFAPLLVTPLVILGVGGLTEAIVGLSAPPTLIYGWMLQAIIPIAPYVAARAFRPDARAPLGGSWVTLLAVNSGAALQWGAVLDRAHAGAWSGLAFAAWAVALVGLTHALWAVASSPASATASDAQGPDEARPDA